MTSLPLLPADATDPCVGCGMCCDGTLYGLAKVAPGEEERIERAGLTITDVGEKRYFRLPCTKVSCGRCMIYETRFAICRSFRCALLRSYQASEVSLDEAQARVAKAQELLAGVVMDNPEAANVDERRRIRSALADASAGQTNEARNTRAQQLLRIIALDVYLERWFRNPKTQAPEADESTINGSNS